jgi:hypothetical protein
VVAVELKGNPRIARLAFLRRGRIAGTEAAIIAMLHSITVQRVQVLESYRGSPTKFAGERLCILIAQAAAAL